MLPAKRQFARLTASGHRLESVSFRGRSPQTPNPGEGIMAKAAKGATIARLQSAARLSRTMLASRLLQQGLYAGQDQVMLSLNEEDGQTPGVLATKLGVRPPTITKTINRLQAQGFLERKASDTDSRQAHIFLTEAGRETIRSIEKSIRKTEKQAMKGLDKKDQKTLGKMLNRIESNLSNIEFEPDDSDDTDE
jgi:DNA-binding MarR family transcriptional regulator